MWIALTVVLALALIVILTRSRSSVPVTPRTPSRPQPVRPPRIGAADDVDEDLTVAAKIMPKIDSGPASTRVEQVAPLSARHEVDDEDDDDRTGLRKLILVNAVARTDVGKLRKNNEDHYLALEDYGVFMVADGMGGHAGGEVASALAAEVIGNAFRRQSFPGARKVTKYRRANELIRALELANEEIRKVAAANADLTDMGTTCVAARFSPGKERVYIVYAGDSRAYLVRDAKIAQLTRDHTLAVEAGAKGSLGAQLTRALGIADAVRPDTVVEDALPSDCYVLCSDGLTKMVADSEIATVVAGEKDLAVAAKKLVALANERGGRDNITVILVRIEPAP